MSDNYEQLSKGISELEQSRANRYKEMRKYCASESGKKVGVTVGYVAEGIDALLSELEELNIVSSSSFRFNLFAVRACSYLLARMDTLEGKTKEINKDHEFIQDLKQSMEDEINRQTEEGKKREEESKSRQKAGFGGIE